MIKEKIPWVKLKLTESPKCRDSVSRLYYIFLRDSGYDLDNPIKTFLQDIENGVIPPIDSIGRASRKVQEECPNLRGKYWKKRKQKSIKIKNEILHKC